MLYDALQPIDRRVHGKKPDHAANIIFTSGSIGRPKGVLVGHQASVNRLLWMQHQYPLTADNVMLQ